MGSLSLTPYIRLLSHPHRQGVLELLKKADASKEKVENFLKSGNPCNISSLQIARMRGSNTLLHGSHEAEYWNLALTTLWTWIQEDRTPDLEGFFEINRILLKLPHEQCSIRKTVMSTGDRTYPSPERLSDLLEGFRSELTSILEHEHPVIQAAWIYQNLVAIHPFQDANGRTSRLAADWVLSRSGFPPLVFLTPIAAMVPGELDHFDSEKRMTGILRVANAVDTSANILTINL